MEGFKKELKNIQKALLTGTSYMMPMVVAVVFCSHYPY